MLVHGAMKQKITMRFPWEGRSTSRKQACREPQLGPGKPFSRGPISDHNLIPTETSCHLKFISWRRGDVEPGGCMNLHHAWQTYGYLYCYCCSWLMLH